MRKGKLFLLVFEKTQDCSQGHMNTRQKVQNSEVYEWFWGVNIKPWIHEARTDI